MNSRLATVALFAYNRPNHLQFTLDALKQNRGIENTALYVFIDGPRKEEDVEKIEEICSIVEEIDWTNQLKVIKSDQNKGLAKSIISGINLVFESSEKVIILEDDLVTGSGFLEYMNEALDMYENQDQVMHVSGYFPPIKNNLPSTFFFNQTSCWGWGTWKRAWSSFESDPKVLRERLDANANIHEFNLDDSYDFYGQLKANEDGSLSTWAILWHTSVYLNNGLCLHPNKSLVKNVGFDGTGVHCNEDQELLNQYITDGISISRNSSLVESEKARKLVVKYNKSKKRSRWYLVQSLKNRMSNLLKKYL